MKKLLTLGVTLLIPVMILAQTSGKYPEPLPMKMESL